MGLFNAIHEWNKGRLEKRIQEMEAQGKCPTCSGRGIDYPIGFQDIILTNVVDCHGCNGSGQYADWAKFNQQ